MSWKKWTKTTGIRGGKFISFLSRGKISISTMLVDELNITGQSICDLYFDTNTSCVGLKFDPNGQFKCYKNNSNILIPASAFCSYYRIILPQKNLKLEYIKGFYVVKVEIEKGWTEEGTRRIYGNRN